jgi:hypothetical protein
MLKGRWTLRMERGRRSKEREWDDHDHGSYLYCNVTLLYKRKRLYECSLFMSKIDEFI